MTPDKWQEVQDLFSAALDLPADQRSEFLSQACAADAMLRAEVESLLAAHSKGTDVIEAPALGQGFSVPAPDSLLRGSELTSAPDRVGPYRLEQIIGSGGMGSVYRAVRDDGEFEQRVAVKFIRYGGGREALLRRFYQERQLLARLNHPNIARLLDGGTTAEGMPYLVMEYIDGRPIDEYCDSRRLSITQRLELFRAVCAAVDAAHRALIVHCDLKPSNILVTSGGVPKLLDFGIARIVQLETPDGAERTTTVPLTLMTPDYASPEQIRGAAVSTSSDVYSLGVILYELLTGRRPFRLKTRVRFELERIVCEQEPPRPSVVVEGGKATAQLCHDRQSSPARWHRRLLGDLDTILLRALRKEPDRRYSSVEQFSEDIRRHLAGLPVIARNDTLMYLASKFIRRRKGVVIAATLVLLSLLGGLFGIIREAKITADQRDIAQANLQRAKTAEALLVDEAATARTSARQAEMINTFLRSMLAAANPYEQGRDVTMIEVLDRAAARVGAELSVEPAVEAAVRRTIGNTYRSLGAYDKAEKHLQAAVAIHQQDYTRNELATNDLARSLIGLAGVLQDRGDYTGAELLYRRALEVYRGLRGDDHLDVIGTMTSLALLLRAKGDEKEADALLRQASERYVRSPRAETREEVDVGGPTSHSHLALLLRYQGDWEGAERLLRQSLAEQHRLYGPQHPRTGDSAAALASFLQEKGDYAAAAEYHGRALAIRRNVPGGAHKLVADSLSALAALSIEQGDYAEAEELLRQALELREQDFDPSHPEIARTMIALGMVLLEQGIPADAEPVLRECLEIQKQALSEDDWRIASTESLLGECLTSSEQYEEAEILLLDALAKLETECGAADERTLEALRRLIALYESWGRPDRAALYRTQPTTPQRENE